MAVRMEIYNERGSMEVVIEEPTEDDFEFIGNLAREFNMAFAERPAEGGQ